MACNIDRCILCYLNRKARLFSRGHRFYVNQMPLRTHTDVVRDERWSTMKRESKAAQGSGESWFMPEDPFLSEWPDLARALTDAFWDDGKPRTPYTLKLSFTLFGVQVSVTDEVERRTAYTTAKTVREGMEALESLLASGGLPWRSWGRAR